MQINGIISLDTHEARQGSVDRTIANIEKILILGCKPSESIDYIRNNTYIFNVYKKDIEDFMYSRKGIALIINEYFAQVPEVRSWIESNIHINKKIILSCEVRDEDNEIYQRAKTNQINMVEAQDNYDGRKEELHYILKINNKKNDLL